MGDVRDAERVLLEHRAAAPEALLKQVFRYVFVGVPRYQ